MKNPGVLEENRVLFFEKDWINSSFRSEAKIDWCNLHPLL